MVAIVFSLAVGIILGAGLAVSQMMNPSKVIAFLDIAGDWDPTLAFVMAGAVLAAIPGFAVAKKRSAPMLGGSFQVPSRRDFDVRLLAGAAMFGAGWGLVGFCPGPALAALGSGMTSVFIFVASMIAGMMLYRLLPSK